MLPQLLKKLANSFDWEEDCRFKTRLNLTANEFKAAGAEYCLDMMVGVGLTLLLARPLIQRTEREALQGWGFSSVVEHLSGKPANARL